MSSGIPPAILWSRSSLLLQPRKGCCDPSSDAAMNSSRYAYFLGQKLNSTSDLLEITNISTVHAVPCQRVNLELCAQVFQRRYPGRVRVAYYFGGPIVVHVL